MEAKKKLKERRKVACAELKKVAMPYIDNKTLNEKSEIIGKRLGVSFQTVVNYVYGKAKDGFLIEALTEEFKNLPKT